MRIRDNKVLPDIINTLEFSLGYNGCSEVDQTWRSDGLRVPFNRLYLVESGQGHLWSDSQDIIMQPGMAYLIPAGHPCSYSCDGTMRKLYFHFNIYKPDHYDLLWGSGQIGVLPLPEQQLQQLLVHWGGSSYLDAFVVHSSLIGLVTQYLRSCAGAVRPFPVYSQPVADTIAYIREHLSARLLIDDLAKRLYISRTCLTGLFRRETGVTLGKYIDDQLMIEAQQRLFHTNVSIERISRELGFCDQFYFSRRFKQLCGFTPLQYRKKQRAELAGMP